MRNIRSCNFVTELYPSYKCSKLLSFTLFLTIWNSYLSSCHKIADHFSSPMLHILEYCVKVHLIPFAMNQLCISIWFAGQLWRFISLPWQITIKHVSSLYLVLCPDHKHRYPFLPLFSVSCSLFLSPLLSHVHEVLQTLCLSTHTFFFPTFPLQGMSSSCFLSSSSPQPGKNPPLWILSPLLPFSFSSLVLLHPY